METLSEQAEVALEKPKPTRTESIKGYEGPPGRLLHVSQQEGSSAEWDQKTVTNDTEMAKIFNAFFTSVFTDKICLQVFQVPENRESLHQGRVILGRGGLG